MSHPSPETPSDLESLRREVHESRSKFAKGFFLLAGCLCVGLGILGVLLPIVPTTPFLLLAAACYARSSERFYVWLLTNRIFGSYIRDWRDNRGLSLPVKVWVISVLAATMGISIYFVPLNPVRILLALTGLGVSTYILRLPTKQHDTREGERTREPEHRP